MDEFTPVSSPPKKHIKKFANLHTVLWYGVMIGVGFCIAFSALVNLYAQGTLKDLLILWQRLPWTIWMIVGLIVLCIFMYVKHRINKDSDGGLGLIDNE